MLEYPKIDPVAIAIGPLEVHWYGLMYLVGFIAAWLLGRHRIRTLHNDWEAEQLSDLIFYSAMGAVLGGRIGYMLFYQFASLVENPLSLFKIWQGGMSFHGGLLGLTAAVWLFSRKVDKPVLQVVDFVAPLAPLGLGFGRIGNFINGELWGRVTTVEWGMVFPGAGPLPRHPSSLYQAFLEGIVLFALVWWFSSKKRPAGTVSGVFLIGYGFTRIAVEFVRQPDDHLGFVASNWLTMGQLLSLPMVLGGAGLIWFAVRRERE